MRGVGRSSAALTIVHALSTGVGCAVGIARFVTATLEAEPDTRESVQITPPAARTPLVEESLRAACRRYLPAGPRRLRLRVDSDIPPGVGLKSSSAVATSIGRAVSEVAGRAVPSEEIAALAAEVGRTTGTSATGALDDALAGLMPGFVITDNRRDRLLERVEAPAGWAAAVFQPPGHHPRADGLADRFTPLAELAQRAVTAAREHRFAEAMAENSSVVEAAMGYDYRTLREHLRGLGARASGVSGFGPAVGALFDSREAARRATAVPLVPGPQWWAELTGGGRA